ncbi:MAG: hypothetical protein WC291_07220 [Thermodesulfovibrionales bacterium]|jgi:hypothetical protein
MDLKMGNVWGKVVSVEQKKADKSKKPYLILTIECGNSRLGAVKAYGRIWNENRIQPFLDFYKAHAQETIRLTGFFSQYAGDDGKVMSNYTFTRWQTDPEKEAKAVFVLKGEVLGTETDTQALHVLVTTEGTDEYQETKEKFTVYVHPEAVFQGYHSFAGFDEIEVGHQVEVSGYLRTRDPEDEFGLSSTDVRPYAMRIKKIATAEAEPAPY